MLPPETMETRVLVQGTTVFRAAANRASHRATEMMQANAGIAARMESVLRGGFSAHVTPIERGPAITRVNGQLHGVVEPGGQYEIAGHGFGRQQGEVFARFAGRTIHLNIDHWSDETIFAGLGGDISGLADDDSIDLYVGVKGAAALKSTRFGFHAARETVAIVPPESSFSFDRGQPFTVFSQTVWPNRAPDQMMSDGEYLNVSRSSFSEDSHAACFPAGCDRIRWNIPLQPGFEVVDFEWYHDPLATGDSDGIQSRHEGTYAADWDGDDIRIDYAVQRSRFAPYLFLDGNVRCASHYKLRLKLSGPRGMPPV